MKWLHKLRVNRNLTESHPVISVHTDASLPKSVRPYYTILTCTLLLTLIGFLLVYSAVSLKALETANSSSQGFRGFWMEILKPIIFTVFGVVGMMIVSRIPILRWRFLGILIYVFSWFLQIITAFMGKTIGGNRNWLDLKVITIQPSELLKLGFILLLATVFSQFGKEIRTGIGAVSYLTFICLLTVVPVLWSGDLGSASIFILIFLGMCFVAHVSYKYIFGFIFFGAMGAAAMVAKSPSRRSRVMTFINHILGYQNPTKGGATQTDHALWAIGNGGLTGQGPGASREKWRHLPTAESDYIFAILGEEYGFLGGALVLLIFIILAYAIFTVAMSHPSGWAGLFCVGIGFWISAQAIVNISVVTGVFPVLGVPLPLISKGYSSLLSILFGIGCVLSLARVLPGAQKIFKSQHSLATRASSVMGRVTRKGEK